MIEPAMRTPPADTEKAVTDQYIAAVNLNRRIITAAQLAQQSLYDMCIGFKEMRDSKLYKELGYSSFEDYCENEAGFSREQGRKYAKIADTFGEENANPGWHLGMKKLYLLTKLSEAERAEITSSTDLESTSVRQLEEQIKQLRSAHEEELNKANGQALKYKSEAERRSKEEQRLNEEITFLNKQIKELESRPVEVAVETRMPPDAVSRSAYEELVAQTNEEQQRLEDELLAEKRNAHKEKAELESRLAEAQAKLEELKNAPPQTVAVADKSEIFKAYFKAAYDGLNRLVEFVKAESSEDFRKRTEKLIDTVKSSL